MNTKPTFGSIRPITNITPFTPHHQSHNRWQRNLHPATTKRAREAAPLGPEEFDANTLVSNTAVAAIQRAFLLAKTSNRNWKHATRYGRPDIRQAPRAARGQLDVFKYRNGKSTTQVRVAVILDASGSMNGHDARIASPVEAGTMITVSRYVAAALFGATVAKALGRIPTITLDVWQHTTGAGAGSVILKWRWHRGTPLGVFNEAANRGGVTGSYGGNADGHALMAVAVKMKRDLKVDERGIILMVSDGLPSDYTRDGKGTAGQALIDAVREVRAMGIEVIAVAIDGSDQTNYYGAGMIPFTGDWMVLGRALADHIGKALAERRR